MEEIVSLFIYNTIVLSPLLLLLDRVKHLRGIYKIIIPICLTYIVILTSIRYNVGRDFKAYTAIFNEPFHFDRERLELGFKSLVDILNYLTHDAFWLFTTVSILIYSVVFLSYKHYRSWVVISLWFLLFFLASLNVLRQAIAIAIVFYTFYFIDINRIKYYIGVVVAGLFHFTGFIALIFPLLSRIKVKYLEILVLFTPLLLFVHIVDFFSQLPFIGNSYYAYYFEDSEVYAGEQTLSIGGVARLIVPFIFIWYFRKNFEPKINLIKNAMFVYIALYFLSLNFYILYRVYFIFQLLIPFACYFLLKERNVKYVVYVYVLILLLLFQKNILESTISPPQGTAVFPYQTIFKANPIH